MADVKLTDVEREFLSRIEAGTHPGLADRKNDRARQNMRRLGFAKCVMNPRRWIITEAGRIALSTTV